MQSFSIIVKLSKNLFKSLLFFKLSSFLIATLALCKLSNIVKFSFAKLKDPNSNASLISFSNLLLWFSTSAKDLSNLSSVSLSFSSIDSSLTSSFHFLKIFLRTQYYLVFFYHFRTFECYIVNNYKNTRSE